MKLYKLILAAVGLVSSTAMVSCDDDFDRPPVIFPQATMKANTTIAELKADFWETAQAATPQMVTIPKKGNGEDYIISGRVVSNDSLGNVYRMVVLQDETSGIAIRVNQTKLYEAYRMGQEVFVNVTGLTIGFYNNLMQIGVPYTNSSGVTSVGNMDYELFQSHSERNGLGGMEYVKSYTTTIADLNTYKGELAQLQAWQYRLVTFENVSFVGGGRDCFGDATSSSSYVTRQLKDEAGNTIAISTSNNKNNGVASMLMPSGTGTVTAILSYFRDGWQLVFSNPEKDCTGDFDWSGNAGPVNPGDAVTSISTDFESGAIPDGWQTVNTSGNRSWIIKDYQGNHYVQASAYNGTPGTNGFQAWLITPALNVDGMTDKVMSFKTEIQYGDQEGSLKLYAMTSADPKTATLTELSFTQPEAGQKGSTGYIASGEISLAQFSGVIYIGWLYEAVDKDNSRTYRIDDVNIGVKAGDEPVTPPAGNTIFEESFGTDQGAFTIDNVNLGGLEKIWGWRANYGMVASAYVNSKPNASDSWLVSPAISLPAGSKAKLTFEQAMNQFKLNGTNVSMDEALKFVTVAVREEGSTAWTTLTVPSWPASLSWTFVPSGDIDLTAYAGKKIQIGFHYTSTADVAGTWEIKNIKIVE